MWDPAELPMTYAPMCRAFSDVRQEDDAIVNSCSEKNGYDYIGLSLREPLSGGVSVSAHCSFENYGAPLLVFGDSIHTDAEGRRLWGPIYEIVAYESGCNVWRVLPDPSNPERPFSAVNLARETFTVAAGSVIDLSARVVNRRAAVRVNDYRFEIDLPELPETFYVGITLCEGINRFYDLKVESV